MVSFNSIFPLAFSTFSSANSACRPSFAATSVSRSAFRMANSLSRSETLRACESASARDASSADSAVAFSAIAYPSLALAFASRLSKIALSATALAASFPKDEHWWPRFASVPFIINPAWMSCDRRSHQKSTKKQ